MKPSPTVFTIPAGVSFVDALVAGIRARHGDDPVALSALIVLLPTRRACRALRDAFLRASGGRPTLLPSLRPIGDVDEDELLLGFAGDDGSDLAAALDLAPALSPMRRRLLLSQLILRKQPGTPPDQALFLAGELTRLLDQMQIEEVPFEALRNIVPADLATHWQGVLEFLTILSQHWPAMLQEQGAQDSAVRRSKLLDAQAAAWEANPPPGPVIAAGSTGTVPAAARLMRSIGRLPQGCIVLPGLDVEMAEETWAQVDPAHPQFAMKTLLDRLGVTRSVVEPWQGEPKQPSRVALIAEAMKPAPAWAERSAAHIGDDACTGLYRLDCANPEEEARAIALALRESLETPGRTAALVTPDRALARRVAAELGRWNIAIDDSAGVPLALTPTGTFLRLSASMVAEELAPIPLLAALKHPLAAGGVAPGLFRARVRRLDRVVLRGPRPAAGFAGLRAALDAKEKDRPREVAVLRPWLDDVQKLAEPFVAAVQGEAADLTALLRAHIEFAEKLAATSDKPSARSRLWSNDDGEAAALWVEELLRVADGGASPRFSGRHYPLVLNELMAGVSVRPRYPKHPRLQIWGPLEARLQQPDVVILGGLNEGMWPPEAPTDAWMSRPMRAKAGLPPPERRTGLAAHDFAQAATAATVLLTRATKVDGAPTVPSRWLDRLDAVLSGHDIRLADAPWLHWQQQLVSPAAVEPLAPPAPKPPVEKRPRRLAATTIETWVRDPYAVYAKHILRLRALDPIDSDPDARERGQIIHDAIDRFLRTGIDMGSPDAVQQMLDLGRESFRDLLALPGVWAFWWPRFERIAAWFVANEREQRTRARLVASEVKGGCDIVAPGGVFRAMATADRIDRLHGGGLAVIDYKTGSVPQSGDIERGFSPQLPIEGMIAADGGFDGVAAEPVVELTYWRLSGLAQAGEVKPAVKTAEAVDALITDLRDGLAAFVAAFDDRAMPYRSRPRPEFAPRYSDYDHLARVREWSAGPGEDEMIAVVPR